MGIAGPLHDVPLEYLQQRFTTVVKVQPRLAAAHAKLFTHVLSLLNHALGGHRQSRQSETPNSLLRAMKLWYILPALLHSQDGRVKRRERFASVARGDITLLLPWLMGYTHRASARRSNPAHETTDEAKFKRATPACRHPGGVTVATRSVLAERRAPGSEATWDRIRRNSTMKIKPLSPRQQRQRWKHVALIRREEVVPSGARKESLTLRSPSRS